MVHFSKFFHSKLKEWSIFFILLFFAVVVSFSTSINTSFLDGVKLWFFSVLPALFPYAVITTLLSGLEITSTFGKKLSPISKRLFRVNGSVFYPLFIGVLSGHPTGVKAVCDLKSTGALSNSESIRASALCSMSSPVFLISCVGGVAFNSVKMGVGLFFVNILSAISVGLIFRFYKGDKKGELPVKATLTKPVSFSTSVSSSVLSVLGVGGFIVLFYMLTDVLSSLGVFKPIVKLITLAVKNERLANGFITGIFESTKGFKILSSFGASPLSFYLASFITGFGGLSVVCQSTALLKSAKIKTAPFILSKILGAVLCLIYSLIICPLIF